MICRVDGCRYPHSHTTRGHLCSVCRKYGHGRMNCGNKHNLKIYYNEVLPTDLQCTKEGCKFKMYHSNDAHHCSKCFQNHSIHECPRVKFTVNIQPKLKIKCPICRVYNEIDLGSNINENSENNEFCCVCINKKSSVLFPKCGHICCCFSCVKKLNESTNHKIYNLCKEIMDEGQMMTFCNLEEIKKSFRNKKEVKIYSLVYAGMGCSLYIRRDFIDGMLLGFFLHSDCQGQYGVNHIPFANKFVEGYTKL